jgi:hypothetical protein
MEAEQLEERQIDYWLSLADSAFDDSWERPKTAGAEGENEQAA